MNDEFQVRFKPEGEPAFPQGADTENEDSAASPAEETDAEETSSSEEEEDSDATTNDSVDEDTEDGDGADDDDEEKGKGPKHTPSPERWQEREDDWKKRFNEQEERHLEQITKLREEFAEKYGKPAQAGDLPSEIPSWFGGDEQQWEDFKKFNQQQIDDAQKRIADQKQKATQEEQKAIQEATDYMKSEIANIETDKTINPDGVKIDQNKLLKFVLDNELVDTQGRWNYRAGFKLMQAGVKNAKKQVIKEKKEIAGATTSGGRAEAEKSDIATSEDFQDPSKRPW